MTKKQVITVDVEDISPYEFETTLGNLKARIDDLITKYGVDANLDWDPDYWPQYNDGPAPRYNVKINREETDKEYDKRITEETAACAVRDERERKEFERLQAKFGAKK